MTTRLQDAERGVVQAAIAAEGIWLASGGVNWLKTPSIRAIRDALARLRAVKDQYGPDNDYATSLEAEVASLRAAGELALWSLMRHADQGRGDAVVALREALGPCPGCGGRGTYSTGTFGAGGSSTCDQCHGLGTRKAKP